MEQTMKRYTEALNLMESSMAYVVSSSNFENYL